MIDTFDNVNSQLPVQFIGFICMKSPYGDVSCYFCKCVCPSVIFFYATCRSFCFCVCGSFCFSLCVRGGVSVCVLCLLIGRVSCLFVGGRALRVGGGCCKTPNHSAMPKLCAGTPPSAPLSFSRPQTTDPLRRKPALQMETVASKPHQKLSMEKKKKHFRLQ